MRTAIHDKFPMILFAFSLAFAATPLTAQVYKVVDKDGNVTYTDQAPADGSGPIELRPISVIEAPTYEKAPAATDADSAEDGKEMSLSYLRKNYKDFAIISPQSEESVWRPDGPIPIAWSSQYALQEGMQVIIMLDGKRQASTTQPMIAVNNLDRGEHVVSAELRDSKNRVIATSGPITFFVRQPSLYNRAVINPNGGG
ncbi:MAG TPA: DUF4124 domain-containing protein [Xanthomonadales bacterium]